MRDAISFSRGSEKMSAVREERAIQVLAQIQVSLEMIANLAFLTAHAAIYPAKVQEYMQQVESQMAVIHQAFSTFRIEQATPES